MSNATIKTYSIEEVRKHDGGKKLAELKKKLAAAKSDSEKAAIQKEISETPSDVWIILHGFIYNVTSYLSHHPGGPEQILGVAGDDATQAFEEIYHSVSARKTLKEFKIGKLDTWDGPDDLIDTTLGSDGKTNVLVTLVPALLAILAAVYYYYFAQ